MIDKLSPERGCGFIDFCDFGRLTLSRANVVFCQPQYMTKVSHFSSLGFTLVLSGEMHLQYTDTCQSIKIEAGQVWWRKGHFGVVDMQIPAQQKLQVLSIDFQQDLLDKLLADKLLQPRLQSLLELSVSQPTADCYWQQVDAYQHALLKTHQLLHLPLGNNELELMQLEGAALGLLADILTKEPHRKPQYQQESIEMAGVILTNECHKKMTIRQLSRRVGLNEFTLKREFKRRYQMTIGEFIRERRMLLALDLLAGGCQLHQVAAQTGYSSKQYFCRVFSQYFGYEPTAL